MSENSRVPTVINVVDVIDRGKLSTLQIRVVVLCAFIQFIDGFDGQAMAYAAPSLVHAWRLNRQVLGPVFSASLGAILLGTILIGPVSDRLGRKPVLVIAMFLVSLATCLTALAGSSTALLALRFFTGLGIGVLLPTSFVLMSEYAPLRRRTFLVLLMACGYAVGAAAGGLITAELLNFYTWQSIFVVGGVLPLLLGMSLWLWLPESPRFLATKKGVDDKISVILRKLNSQLIIPENSQFKINTDAPRGSFLALFADGRGWVTPLLWALLFFNFIPLNFLNSWLPVILNEAGLPIQRAVRITTTFQMGGLVAIISLGLVADWLGTTKSLFLILVTSAIAISLIGYVSHAALAPIVGLAGFCVIGGQNILFALSASTYPTPIRSTGAGWAQGIGRIGSIVGPMLGGMLVVAHLPVRQLFIILAVPAILELACLGAMVLAKRRQKIAEIRVASYVPEEA